MYRITIYTNEDWPDPDQVAADLMINGLPEADEVHDVGLIALLLEESVPEPVFRQIEALEWVERISVSEVPDED